MFSKFSHISNPPFHIIIKSSNRSSKALFINKRYQATTISELMKIPANIYWKNKNSIYMGCNDANAQASGLHSKNDFIGSRIYDFDEECNAQVIERNDAEVMATGITKYLIERAVSKYDNIKLNKLYQSLYISIKQCLYDEEGIVIGMFGVSLDFELLQYIDWNLYAEILCKDDFHQINLAITHHLFSRESEITRLTPREKQCLFYVARGRSTKEIALILNLSPKTVESYWESIKFKLDCHSKSEVFDKYLEFRLLTC